MPECLHLFPYKTVNNRLVSVLYNNTVFLWCRHSLFAFEAYPQGFQPLGCTYISGIVKNCTDRRRLPAAGILGYSCYADSF